MSISHVNFTRRFHMLISQVDFTCKFCTSISHADFTCPLFCPCVAVVTVSMRLCWQLQQETCVARCIPGAVAVRVLPVAGTGAGAELHNYPLHWRCVGKHCSSSVFIGPPPTRRRLIGCCRRDFWWDCWMLVDRSVTSCPMKKLKPIWGVPMASTSLGN